MEPTTKYLSPHFSADQNLDLIAQGVVITKGLKAAESEFFKSGKELFLDIAKVIMPLALTIFAYIAQVTIAIPIACAGLTIYAAHHVQKELSTKIKNFNNTYITFKSEKEKIEKVYNSIIEKINEKNKAKNDLITESVISCAEDDPSGVKDLSHFFNTQLYYYYKEEGRLNDNPTEEEKLAANFLTNIKFVRQNSVTIPKVITNIYKTFIDACQRTENDAALYNTLRGNVASILKVKEETLGEWTKLS